MVLAWGWLDAASLAGRRRGKPATSLMRRITRRASTSGAKENPSPPDCAPLKRRLRRLRTANVIALVLLLIGYAKSGQADPAALLVELDGQTRHFSAVELLANPATHTLEIPHDPAYGRSMRYQAIPLLELMLGLRNDATDTIEARASDGFVSQLPWSLVESAARGGAVAWIAIEDPAHPWPSLAGKSFSAGPFYLVWEHPEHSGVTSEQWPYALASLTGVSDPLRRWPQLSIADSVPADDPFRRGQAVFLVQCLPCHRLLGAGEGDQGPDLGLPMAATAYMTHAGLKALLRNPAAVRNWPQRQMPGFDPETLPDPDIDAVIAYLARITELRR
jgi:mono/diheme cytochrome c family protein